MKALQIHIALKRKRKKVERTLILPKKETFHHLHEAIQLAFNLSNLEAYEFTGEFGIISQIKYDSKVSFPTRKLLCLKEQDVFTYQYDRLETLTFVCTVEKILDIKEWKISLIHSVGNALYDNVHDTLDAKQMAKTDMNWINQCLDKMSWSEENQQYHDEIEDVLKELCSIKYFQDFIHQQIFEIILPMNHRVYFGCDCTESVHVNYYASYNKLAEYMCHNPKGLPASVEKYHDCISCVIYRLENPQEKDYYDYIMNPYGAFITCLSVAHNEMIPAYQRHMYLMALRQFVKCVHYCQGNNLKSAIGQMITIDWKDHIRLGTFQIKFPKFEVASPEQLQECFQDLPRNEDVLEMDVITVLDYPSEELFTSILAIGIGSDIKEILLQNTSFKTIFPYVRDYLIDYWEKQGLNSLIKVRDENMENLLQEMCRPLQIDLQVCDRLTNIDQYFFNHYFTNRLSDHDEASAHQIILEVLRKLGVDEEFIAALHDMDGEDMEEDVRKIKKLLSQSSIDYKKLN